MSTIGSKLEASFAQAAAAAHHVARAREREIPKTESRRAVQDQLDLRSSGGLQGSAVRPPAPGDARKEARKPGKSPRPSKSKASDAGKSKPRIDLKA